MPDQHRRVHVTPSGDGGWNVTPEHQEPISHHSTQAEAQRAARKYLEGIGGELVIHGADGRIRESDTIPPARDPFPPRG